MSSTIDTTPFQSLLDDAVAEGMAPGFQCVVFNRDSVIYNGVSGLAFVRTVDSPGGKPMKRETLHWVASCSKISLSLIVLHIIEKGLTKSGFSMKDLDSHEALIEVLPEFKHGSGSLVTKLIVGIEDKLSEDGRKVMKLKDAKGQVTLRMLLTHTAGFSYSWDHPLIAELFFPSDGSVPNFMIPDGSGNIRDFTLPLVHEPGTVYHYGPGTDWLGQFAVRASGKNLRQLHKEIIFDPLGIPASEADLWISPSLSHERAPIYIRNADNAWVTFDYPIYECEGTPPEGKAHYASASIISSLQAYAKVLQAVAAQDNRILGKELWETAVKDDLRARGLKVSRPAWTSTVPNIAYTADEFSKSATEDGAGINLLQCHVALSKRVSGRPAGSFGWAGLANTHYFIDPNNGVGAILGAQVLPLWNSKVIEMRDKLEMLVYKTLVDK